MPIKRAINSCYFFKLMKNIVFEKAVENLRKIVKMRLVNNAKNCKTANLYFTADI